MLLLGDHMEHETGEPDGVDRTPRPPAFDAWTPVEQAEYLLRGKEAAVALLRDSRTKAREEATMLKAAVAELTRVVDFFKAQRPGLLQLLKVFARCPNCRTCADAAQDIIDLMEDDAADYGLAEGEPKQPSAGP